jgi:hypothetical protein
MGTKIAFALLAIYAAILIVGAALTPGPREAQAVTHDAARSARDASILPTLLFQLVAIESIAPKAPAKHCQPASKGKTAGSKAC